MKIALTFILFYGVFSTSIKELKKLKNTLEKNPIITAEKERKA